MSNEFIDVKKLSARIAEVKEELAKLLHLESFLGLPAKAKRGRKPSKASKTKGNYAGNGRKAKKTRGKRGSVSEGILKFLSTKGDAGAHVKDIAAATGNKPANVTAYFYSKAGKKNTKALGGATFALKK